MRIAQENKRVFTNSEKTSEFGIAESAIIYKLFSDTIYQHKVAAVVREITSNAVDAHTQAGKLDVPFKVTLPSRLHPSFEVEDFGIGMSPETVYEIYTKYTASTKRDSDAPIGGFGVGAKTPFAYATKSFDLHSRYNGMEYHYTAYMNGEGIPEFDEIGSWPTDKPNGVKVTIPVLEQDFYAFKRELAWVLSFYRVPAIVNDPTFSSEYPDLGKKVVENGYVFKKNFHSHSDCFSSSTKVYAVLNGVCFPVHGVKYFDGTDNPHIRENFFKIITHNNNNLIVNFDGGDLDVALSRESLSMTERTIDNIKKKVTGIVDSIIETHQKEIDKHDHVIDVVEYLVYTYNIDRYNLNNFYYKDKKNSVGQKYFSYMKQVYNILEKLGLKTYLVDTDRKDNKVFSSCDYNVERFFITSVQTYDDVKWIINDDNSKPDLVKSHVGKYARNQDNILSDTMFFTFTKPIRQERIGLIERMLRVKLDLLKISDIKIANKQTNVHRNVGKKQHKFPFMATYKTYRVDGDVVNGYSRKFHKEMIEKLHENSIIINHTESTLYGYENAFVKLLTAFMDVDIIFIQRTSSNKKNIDNLGIPSLEDAYNWINNPEFAEYIKGTVIVKRKHTIDSNIYDIADFKNKDVILDAWNKYKNSVGSHITADYFYKTTDPNVKTFRNIVLEGEKTLTDAMIDIKMKYPLLGYINSDASYDAIKHYVLMCNKMRENENV